MTPEDIERICSDLSNDLPDGITRTNLRDLICEILWQVNLHPQDLPLLMIMVLDKYSLSNVLESAHQASARA
jgi:hypothetical protein